MARWQTTCRRWVQNILLVLALTPLASLVLTGIVTHKPTIFGYRPMVVLTDSMVPTFPVRSIIIGVPVEYEELEVGDVITYSTRGGVSPTITHRVTEIVSNGVVCKGDNNDVPDESVVLPEQIMYKIIYPKSTCE